MIVNKLLNYNTSQYVTDDGKGDIRSVDKDLITLFNCLQGRVRFGPGTSGNDGENIYGQFLQILTSGTSNAETTYTHTMGAVPVGYIVLWTDKSGNIYQGPSTGTAWTKTSISLKSSGSAVTALLFLLK